MKIRGVSLLFAVGVAVLVVPSCAKTVVPIPFRAPDQALEAHCSTLTKQDCVKSRECSMILNPPDSDSRYRCVAPRSLCEDGIEQLNVGETERLCSQRPGCEFEPENCYCPCGHTGTDVWLDCPQTCEARPHSCKSLKTDIKEYPTECFCMCSCGGGPAANCVAPRHRHRERWPD